MPEVGGVELARRFAEKRPHCPVLLMSGYTDRLVPADLAGCLVEKPFTPSTILRRVREALDSREAGASAPES
jgi:FixJ family two-component response regulator